jgi:hypothetical protein
MTDIINNVDKSGYTLIPDCSDRSDSSDLSKSPPVNLHIGKPSIQPLTHTRCVVIGDTFGNNFSTHPGDIFIHLGNFTTWEGHRVFEFTEYLRRLPHKYKIVLGGENETSIAYNILKWSKTCIFLNGTTIINNLRIHAATNMTKNGEIIFRAWNVSPDIIVSAIPPAGIFDNDMGSVELRDCLERFPPRVCIFAGQASDGGAKWIGQTLYINAGAYQFDWDAKKYQHYGIPLVVDVL